ncbi:autophagy protein 16, interacts with Atg12p-Atg5p [Recurvomyces mirabilis]|nr:autophagy protein 16, interacts with Atg12p-Atg5p [Recurvomyces mirabilis]
MSDWIEQYSAALTERDGREQAHKAYIDAYTKLADRTVALSSEASAPPTPSSPKPSSAREQSGTPVKGKAVVARGGEQDPTDVLSRLRQDLATTQKARATLQAQVDDLTTSITALQTQSKASTTQIAQLTRQKAEVERKLRDREEEVRVKTKMATDATDEMVALDLQLNLAEAKSKKLVGENKDLVDRWMKRMGQEADNMNRDSKWE